jgi:hypothetical protein
MKRSVITTACAVGLALSQAPSSALAQQAITISSFAITNVQFGVSHAQVVISGTIVCNPSVYDWSGTPFSDYGKQPVVWIVSGQVSGFSRNVIVQGSGSVPGTVQCNGEFQPWSLVATSTTVAFNNGPATVTATAIATDATFNYPWVTVVTSATPKLHP